MTDVNANPFGWDWQDDLESDDSTAVEPDDEQPGRPDQRPMIEGIHVRNGHDPDELLLAPVDTPDTAVGETWVLASGDQSFVDLADWR